MSSGPHGGASPPPEFDWAEWNQSFLAAAIERVRNALLRQAGKPAEPLESIELPYLDDYNSSIEILRDLFDLTPFECEVLVLCVAVELDSEVAELCGALQGADRPHATFALALAALPEAHWSALSPARSLRRWRLIEVGPGGALTGSPLRIDERIMNFLVGLEYADERLSAMLERDPPEIPLAASHDALARQAAAVWADTEPSHAAIVQLCGGDPVVKRAIGRGMAGLLNLQLFALSAHSLPAAAEMDRLLPLLERECILSGGAVFLECESAEADAAREQAATAFLNRLRAPLILSSPHRRSGIILPVVSIDVPKAEPAEQRECWRREMAPHIEAGEEFLDALVSQFHLNPHDIARVCAAAEARMAVEEETPSDEARRAAIWTSCRVQMRPRMDDLAQRIESAAAWDDLILPDAQRQVLRDIAAHVRYRTTVYERWGFGARGTRGLGIGALFSGASGTGKTMAAEVLARELELDLYRIDLSSVVSKFIGETEKNLRRVFDAAEDGGVVLLFDEADALFGKRSDVKDSHDRFANIEVSYLLQRVEAYMGLAILTTNLKEAVDEAFLRRIRFMVQFPFPDAEQREEIWRRAFPRDTPTSGLDFPKLANLAVAGGSIRNIALRAAFAAAESGGAVTAAHLLRAAKSECEKLERPLSPHEIRGWL